MRYSVKFFIFLIVVNVYWRNLKNEKRYDMNILMFIDTVKKKKTMFCKNYTHTQVSRSFFFEQETFFSFPLSSSLSHLFPTSSFAVLCFRSQSFSFLLTSCPSARTIGIEPLFKSCIFYNKRLILSTVWLLKTLIKV